LTGLYKDDELVMNRLVPEDNERSVIILIV